MIYLLAIFIGLATGCLFAIQPSINGSLSSSLEHPIQASLISFVTGTVTLLAFTVASGNFPPRFTVSPNELPFWVWLGGVIGVIVVTSSLIFVPKVGGVSLAGNGDLRANTHGFDDGSFWLAWESSDYDDTDAACRGFGFASGYDDGDRFERRGFETHRSRNPRDFPLENPLMGS